MSPSFLGFLLTDLDSNFDSSSYGKWLQQPCSQKSTCNRDHKM